MIDRIFIDLDECLLYSTVIDPEQDSFTFSLEGDPLVYYTIVRPQAKPLLEFCRGLVGTENVFALTTSTTDYANKVNEIGGLGWERKQIFAREALDAARMQAAWGGHSTYPNASLMSPNNVLIDNLPPHYNKSKMNFIGISKDRYIEVSDYYGVNFPDSTFLESVKEQCLAMFNENE